MRTRRVGIPCSVGGCCQLVQREARFSIDLPARTTHADLKWFLVTAGGFGYVDSGSRAASRRDHSNIRDLIPVPARYLVERSHDGVTVHSEAIDQYNETALGHQVAVEGSPDAVAQRISLRSLKVQKGIQREHVHAMMLVDLRSPIRS